MTGQPVGATAAPTACVAFTHEAFFYDGDDEFVVGCLAFIREGLEAGDHVVVAVVPEKTEMLRAALGEQAAGVTFIDMAECGRNPARIIQVWRDLVEAAELRGARVRGIGEPIWVGRTDEEMLEAQLHEALLNTAFGDGSSLLLRCPYDVSRLAGDVVSAARATHPAVVDGTGRTASPAYCPDVLVDAAFLEPLPEPVDVEEELRYGPGDLMALRRLVADVAGRYGVRDEAAQGLVLAVREIAVNSIRHGGGAGRLRVWGDRHRVVCELSDSGRISESMVGRLRPHPDIETGRGVWLANQLCDLVQIRTSARGTVVRLHAQRRPVPETVA